MFPNGSFASPQSKVMWRTLSWHVGLFPLTHMPLEIINWRQAAIKLVTNMHAMSPWRTASWLDSWKEKLDIPDSLAILDCQCVSKTVQKVCAFCYVLHIISHGLLFTWKHIFLFFKNFLLPFRLSTLRRLKVTLLTSSHSSSSSRDGPALWNLWRLVYSPIKS